MPKPLSTMNRFSITPDWTLGNMRTSQAFYDDVEVPKEALGGEKNRGFYYILEALDHERVSMSAGLKREFQEIVDYIKENGIGKDPLVRQKIAELATDIKRVLRIYKTVVRINRARS